jgi:predicted dehydrogenase
MIGVAVAGFGYWGPTVARNLASLPGVRVERIADPDAARRALAARLFPAARVDGTLDPALADPAVAAVAIATPVATHHALARAALDAGRHVLVEKPMTATLAQARDLVAAAARARRVLAVDHPFAHAPAVERLHAMVARGELGRLRHYDSTRANLGPFHSDVDVVGDLAVHDLSILDRLTGRSPDRVAAIAAGDGRIAHLMLHYDDGLLAHLHLSWLSPLKLRRVSLAGERALVVYDEGEPAQPLRVFAGGDVDGSPGGAGHRSPGGEGHGASGGTDGSPGDGAPGADGRVAMQRRIAYRVGDMVAPRLEIEEPVRRVCAAFVDAIAGGAPPRCDGAAGLRTVRVLDAARRSLAAGGAAVAIGAPGARAALPDVVTDIVTEAGPGGTPDADP